jgi:hypothetical protein
MTDMTPDTHNPTDELRSILEQGWISTDALVAMTGILEVLMHGCRLSVENIARLTGLGIDVIENALRSPQDVPLAERYTLALRASYLINAVNQARPR